VVADNGTAASNGGGAWADRGAGALNHDEYVDMMVAAGLTNVSIEYTHDTDPGRHGAIIRASHPPI